MYLYARKKDFKEKIPKKNLKKFEEDAFEVDCDSLDSSKMLELIKSRNIFVEQDVKFNDVYFSLFKQVGYWRKANAVHNWFVENVQDGNDNCGYYVVTKEKIEELKETCKKVLETLNDSEKETIKDNYNYDVEQYKNIETAKDLLPTQAGFFFGSTAYGQYYKEDLEETIRICNYCGWVDADFEFVYHSSW